MELPALQLASASGNAFAYLWADQAPAGFDGPAWARALCPRGTGLNLDGLFLVEAPEPGRPWRLEHWDADGSASFCGTGTRAALALRGAPLEAEVAVRSNGIEALLRREDGRVGLRLPEGPDFGLRPADLDLDLPWAHGWIGNPQLVVEVPDAAAVVLPSFAPPLRHHPAFPEGANINVVQVLGPGRARIRSWERGVEGETPCCGTGCAVAGAWLAGRGGPLEWELVPSGGEAVRVAVGALDGPRWRDLWLSGPVRRLGSVAPDPVLTPRGTLC